MWLQGGALSSALIAAVNCSVFLYSQWYLPHLGDGFAFHTMAALVILVGLGLFSKIARYAGAAFYFLSAGAAALALWRFSGPMHVGVVWSGAMIVLGLAGAVTLVSQERSRESLRLGAKGGLRTRNISLMRSSS